MDLGPSHCSRSKPRCAECPLQRHCVAPLQGDQALYPGKKTKKTLPEKQSYWLLLQYKQQVYVLQRPASGLWGGLFGFLEFNSAELRDEYLALQGLATMPQYELAGFRHTFSHFHLWIQPLLLKLQRLPAMVQEQSAATWFTIDPIPEVGLSAPAKQLLQQLAEYSPD